MCILIYSSKHTLHFSYINYEISSTFVKMILSHLIVIVSRYENRKATIRRPKFAHSPLYFPLPLPKFCHIDVFYFLGETRLSSLSQSLLVDGGNFRNMVDSKVAKFHWKCLFAPSISNLIRIFSLTPFPPPYY